MHFTKLSLAFGLILSAGSVLAQDAGGAAVQRRHVGSMAGAAKLQVRAPQDENNLQPPARAGEILRGVAKKNRNGKGKKKKNTAAAGKAKKNNADPNAGFTFDPTNSEGNGFIPGLTIKRANNADPNAGFTFDPTNSEGNGANALKSNTGNRKKNKGKTAAAAAGKGKGKKKNNGKAKKNNGKAKKSNAATGKAKKNNADPNAGFTFDPTNSEGNGFIPGLTS